MVSETICRALCCRGVAVEAVSQPICQHCVAGVQLFKWCGNLSAGTVLQWCGLFKRCRKLSVRHCAAGVQLFKQCRNLSTSTVLQGCSCLSGVQTYLLALYCRGADVSAVSKPICWHYVLGLQAV